LMNAIILAPEFVVRDLGFLLFEIEIFSSPRIWDKFVPNSDSNSRGPCNYRDFHFQAVRCSVSD